MRIPISFIRYWPKYGTQVKWEMFFKSAGKCRGQSKNLEIEMFSVFRTHIHFFHLLPIGAKSKMDKNCIKKSFPKGKGRNFKSIYITIIFVINIGLFLCCYLFFECTFHTTVRIHPPITLQRDQSKSRLEIFYVLYFSNQLNLRVNRFFSNDGCYS